MEETLAEVAVVAVAVAVDETVGRGVVITLLPCCGEALGVVAAATVDAVVTIDAVVGVVAVAVIRVATVAMLEVVV